MRLKYLTLIFFILISLYSAINIVGNPLAAGTKGACTITAFNSLLTWDSGCFYSAYFNKNPTLQQVEFEHQKLTTFKEKGGVVQHVVWYRSIFYQRFKDRFNISYDELDEMHKDFTKTNPTRTRSQVDYIKYLKLNNEHQRAQIILDYYCTDFIPKKLKGVVHNLNNFFKESKLKMSMQVCNQKVDI